MESAVQREDSSVLKASVLPLQMYVYVHTQKCHRQDLSPSHWHSYSHPCFSMEIRKTHILGEKTKNPEITKISWKRTEVGDHRHTDIHIHFQIIQIF